MMLNAGKKVSKEARSDSGNEINKSAARQILDFENSQERINYLSKQATVTVKRRPVDRHFISKFLFRDRSRIRKKR